MKNSKLVSAEKKAVKNEMLEKAAAEQKAIMRTVSQIVNLEKEKQTAAVKTKIVKLENQLKDGKVLLKDGRVNYKHESGRAVGAILDPETYEQDIVNFKMNLAVAKISAEDKAKNETLVLLKKELNAEKDAIVREETAKRLHRQELERKATLKLAEKIASEKPVVEAVPIVANVKPAKTVKKSKATKGLSMEALAGTLLTENATEAVILTAFTEAYKLKGIEDKDFLTKRIAIYMKIAEKQAK